MNLFELFVKIGVDDQASDKIKTISDSVGPNLKKAADVGKAAIVGLAGGFGALAKIGFDYNKEMESYTTNFETMLGSQEAALSKVEELKKIGAETPFEMSDLADATKTLLAFNVSSDESTEILTKLGDISLGNVQKLSSLTRAYGKMNASQKVTLEDINMMIDAGFNPLLLVAEQTGETMTDVYDRISKGGVSFNEIQKAIDKATSAGGQFFNGMEKSSKTTEGLLSTLSDNVQSKIGEMFQSVSDKAKDVLPDVIEFVDSFDTEEAVENVENLVEKLKPVVPLIAGIATAYGAYKTAQLATESLTVAQTALNAVLKANPYAVAGLALSGLIGFIAVYTREAEEAKKNTGFLNDEQKKLISNAEETTKKLDSLKESALKLADAEQANIDYTEDLWKSLQYLTDENGKVKEGYESRAQYILTELNQALGTEYQMNDGIIDQYAKMKTSIEDIIKAKKAESLLDIYSDTYEQYIKSVSEVEKANVTRLQELAKQEQKALQAESDYNEILAEFEALGEINEENFSYAQHLADRVDQLRHAYEEEKEILQGKQAEYDAAKDSLYEYYSTIEDYETASTLILEGEVEKAISALNNIGGGFKTASSTMRESAEEQYRILKQQVMDTEIHAQLLKDAYAKGVKGVSEENVKIAEEEAERAKAEFEAVGGEITKTIADGATNSAYVLHDSMKNLVKSSLEVAGAVHTDYVENTTYEQQNTKYERIWAEPVRSMAIYLDSGELVGGTAPLYNRTLATTYSYEARGLA